MNVLEKRKIAIFNWGELSIHSYYLANQLAKENIIIDIFLYKPSYSSNNEFINIVLEKLKKKVNVIQFHCSKAEELIIKVNYFFRKINLHIPDIYINPFLPGKTRKKFRSENYDYTITVSQSSLYWLFRTDKKALAKNLHYSLEIQKTSDPDIDSKTPLFALINEEKKLMKLTKGLIIQDELRAKALIVNDEILKSLSLIYFPVSVPGEVVIKKSDYFHSKFNLKSQTKILLYFGAIYQERKVDELVHEFEKTTNDKLVLVLHGQGEFSNIIKEHGKVKASNVLLDYHEISQIICSATIGISFYDNGWPNTRLTAFSSEKIARYLQAGVPFIAFVNESYLKLQSEFICCELIVEMDELELAINKILANYNLYKEECYKAYNKYYKIENSIKTLSNFIKGVE